LPVIAAMLSLATVALTLLFTDLPDALLVALIIHAVSHPMKAGEMRRFHRLGPASGDRGHRSRGGPGGARAPTGGGEPGSRWP